MKNKLKAYVVTSILLTIVFTLLLIGCNKQDCTSVIKPAIVTEKYT